MTSWGFDPTSAMELFPPTPEAWRWIWRTFAIVSLLQWTPLGKFQAMGKTSSDSKHWTNLPGRYAWAVAEVVGPLNMIYILYTLPAKLRPIPDATSSLFGTGLPIQRELLGLFYVIHYANRAVICPLFLAPSMSPIFIVVSVLMATFQFLNSSNIACWLVYTTLGTSENTSSLLSVLSIIGVTLFVGGLVGNIVAENELFALRRGAAKRKAKSEGKATITYDKVYVIPPAQGLYKYVLYPHFALEWVEWTGFWILGGAWGLGWGWKNSAALWFLTNELATMLPRTVSGRKWYEQKFGKRSVANRQAVIPGVI